MDDLDQYLRDATVEIDCEHCHKTHDIRLTGFGGTYICKCGGYIKTSDDDQVTVLLSCTDKVH